MFLVSLTRVRRNDLVPALRTRIDGMVQSSVYRVDFDCLGVVTTEVESVDNNFLEVSRSSLFGLVGQFDTPKDGGKNGENYQFHNHPVRMSWLLISLGLPSITHIFTSPRE